MKRTYQPNNRKKAKNLKEIFPTVVYLIVLWTKHYKGE